MGKPFIFSVFGWLSAYAPEWLLRGLCRALIFGPLLWERPGIRSMLRRVLAFQGKDSSGKAISRLAGEMTGVYVGTIVNLCYLCRGAPSPQRLSAVRLELLPALRALHQKKKGVILATPHFGDLYMAMAALSMTGIPLTVLMVGGQNFRWIPSKTVRFLPLTEGAGACLEALRRSEAVLLYDDLDFFPGGRTAEFFGAPFYPPHGPARLALASGAAILPMYSVWSPEGTKVLGGEPILPEGLSQERLEELLLRDMERHIGAHPEQWHIFGDPWDFGFVRRRARLLLSMRT